MALDVYKDWLGIPDAPRPPDHYALLRCVRFEDEPDKIRGNYKKLNGHVRKYASGQYSIQSQDLLNELAKAMLCLTDVERKREYDESLGREFEEESDTLGRKPLLSWLRSEGVILADQIKEVESFADVRGLSNRDAVVQMKLVDAETAARGLAQELGRSFLDLSETIPDDSVLDQIPRNLVKRHSFLPLFIDDDVLLIACVDEPEPELEEELRLRFEIPLRPVIAAPLEIQQGIAKYYAPGARDETVAEQTVASTGKKKKKSRAKEKPAAKAKAKRTATSRLSPEEQRQRKLMGMLIIGWSTIGSAVIDQMVLKPIFVPSWSSLFLLTAIAPIVVGIYVVKVYWK